MRRKELPGWLFGVVAAALVAAGLSVLVKDADLDELRAHTRSMLERVKSGFAPPPPQLAQKV